MRPTRVLVVAESDIVRTGVRAVLGADPAIHVVGTVTNGGRCLRLIDELSPDVVVIEDPLSGFPGASLCSRLLEDELGVAVLLVSTDAGSDANRHLIRSGAIGLFHLSAATADLCAAIHTVAAGQVALDPRLVDVFLDEVRDTTIATRPRLSRREMEVMRMVVRGMSDRMISKELRLSVHTVKTYVRRSLDKLACRTRSEAATRYARWSDLA